MTLKGVDFEGFLGIPVRDWRAGKSCWSVHWQGTYSVYCTEYGAVGTG